MDRVLAERLVRSLPGREQEVVLLRYVSGLTQSEIADRIGVSQMHVSRLLRRSILRMKIDRRRLALGTCDCSAFGLSRISDRFTQLALDNRNDGQHWEDFGLLRCPQGPGRECSDQDRDPDVEYPEAANGHSGTAE